MKNFFVLFVLSFIVSATFSQTLFTYATQGVSRDEFLRAYNKNKISSADKSTALREYLDLYIKFKLKVKAAYDMHLDTHPGLKNDLVNFRNQIVEGYLYDEKEVNALVQEAFTRSQKDIHIAHLFIPTGKSTAAVDTIKIYNDAQDAFKLLTVKHLSFGDVAEALKRQSISASWSDVGFITVFSIPYEFENIVYQLKPGQISNVHRSKNGYHIFQNIEERKAAGKMKAAQILIAVPAGANDNEKNTAFKLADSVYRMLRTGAEFGEMAKIFSNDKMTFQSGGVMPEFGTGKYDQAFESKAFSLQKNDEITTPFQTSFGYHIVKRIDRTTIPQDKNDTDYLYFLKQQVQQDERILSVKENFLKEILKKLAFKKNTGIKENDLWRVTDSFVLSDKKINTPGLNERTLLHSFNNNKVTVADWLQFAKNYRNNIELDKDESNQELMKKYISITAFERYRQSLENYNNDFKYQLKEFKDGNMLFEIMEKSVWSKAANDSAGLIKFYNQNKDKYRWNESADVILISCVNENLAKITAEQIKVGKSWKQVMEQNQADIQIDSGRYELDQIPVQSNTKLSAGMVTNPIVNTTDSTATFVKILRLYPANQPRNFEEARGLVINDYQNFLEEKWIEQLKKKYPVKVNEKVFQTLIN
ncbi:MAG: peptidylprolyl isomerase [Chitinophagaceae bacterium]|nr:peptidylprolyl isomerase [Chitinophagaceae bacterium]